MDGIKQQQNARKIELMNKRHDFALKKKSREHRNEIDKVKNKYDTDITNLRKDYNNKFASQQNQLEGKLIEIRKKNEEVIKNEEDRYKKIIDDLKAAQNDQMVELQTTHEREIERQKSEFDEYIRNAEMKLENHKAKSEA